MKGLEKIVEEYRNLAILHWKASREGDYKTANKNYAKLTKIYEMFLNDKELQEKVLPQLLDDSMYCVQLWAAAHCLGLELYKDEAIHKLEQISTLNSNEAPSFEAKMTLKVWREKGVLTF
ncbi:DUF2019 domain-containing protein [Acetivibrio clariflavus]|uniref:DUF2019 domain-containing protein n=1 Tax=Acetivibrio clariflavus TaxID=288965 RepID=UPI0004841B0D|nr:DUF2019 domain-containing protein [Acetivibrio clariflavus]